MEVMTLPSGILNVAFNKLGSEILQQIGMLWGLADNLDELKKVMEIITDGLEAAEEQAIEDKQLSTWLRMVHDVASDADDLLHELHTKAEKYELKMHENKWGSKVCQGLEKLKLANKIKEFKSSFEALAKMKESFHFEKNLGKGVTLKNDHRTTISSIETEKVIGREGDKKKIRNKVTKIDGHQKVSVISIIGLGGLGKTTLAQLVYNDDVVQKHFKQKMWIYVSENFDTRRLMRALFESVTDKTPDIEELSLLGEKIKEKLKGKKFLLVLDDVWDPDMDEWEKFISLLSVSEAGSKIIVTTRSTDVAKKLGSTFEHNVESLSYDDSWTLFKQRAFPSDCEELNPELVKIGKEILQKCGGVPLAVKALGSILSLEQRIEGWKLVRDSNVWRQPEGNKVMMSLRLSYYRLPSHLKQCFTICSVFPKGHRIDKEQLIDLWIAHDMISLADGVDHLEYNGNKCFSSLVQMSFLEDVNQGFNGRVTCRMHDLVHDLARSILGDEISNVVPEKTTDAKKSYRYFSLIEQTGNVPLKRLFEKARALYVANGDLIFGKPEKNAKYLRSITMERVNTESMLIAMLQTKNLRYLHMSRLVCETLPEAISNIRSLQSLHITDCRHLREIPKSIGMLKKLRTLNLSNCVSLLCLPDSICDCCMISTLDLTKCGLIKLPDSIGRNKNLRLLRLCASQSERLPSGSYVQVNLECLERLPSCITALENLECLDLRGCWGISKLPEGMGNLKKLKVLNLELCTKIERLPSGITTLENLECLDLMCGGIIELPEGMGNLKKLEVLNLEGCNKLCGLPIGFGQLTRLQKLRLFVVGVGEKSARISELGTLGKICGKLTIRNIACMNDPDDVSKACLKEKAKISNLILQWGSGTSDLIAAKEAAAILEGLEPPSRIERLEISGYPSVRFARWMLRQHGDVENTCSSSNCLDIGVPLGRPCHFQCMTELVLSGFPRLKRLQGLIELPCLEVLHMEKMPALESISGGPFPSLMTFYIGDMPSLEELWTVTQFTFDDGEEGGRSMDHGHCCSGQVQISSSSTCFPRLSSLVIRGCPKLEAKPYLPSSLKSLELEKSNRQLLRSPFHQGQGYWSCNDVGLLPPSFDHLKNLRLRGMTVAESGSGCGWELLQHLTALESLWVSDCDGLTELPESVRSLISLRSLSIIRCSALRVLPEWLGELRSLQEMTIRNCGSLCSLPPSMQVQHLAGSLQVLRITGCGALQQLPEWLGELHSLRRLYIGGSPCLSSLALPDRALRELELWGLPCQTCFPQSMRRLTSLERLRIMHCEGITSLPAEIQGLTALRELIIDGCKGITSLPAEIQGLTSLQRLWIMHCEGITSLPAEIQGLTSLQKLNIMYCEGITSLPAEIQGLTALQELGLYFLRGLTCLPQSMRRLTSLQRLVISNCDGITSLPAEIQGLTALQELLIWCSPDLKRRCERGKGQDWHLISHIPFVFVSESVHPKEER